MQEARGKGIAMDKRKGLGPMRTGRVRASDVVMESSKGSREVARGQEWKMLVPGKGIFGALMIKSIQ